MRTVRITAALLALTSGMSGLGILGVNAAHAAGIVDTGVSKQTRGYVLTQLRFVTPGAGPGDCPSGFNEGYSQRFLSALAPEERKPYEADPKLLQQALAPWYYDNPEQDPCANPEAFSDPGMHTIDRPLALQRMAPDGSLSVQELPPGQCPTADAFAAMVEQRTIDNQYWRVMGCVRGYQPGGIVEAFSDSGILDGSMTIVLEIDGPASGGNGDVEVRLYSSEQPVTIGTDGAPLPFATFPAVPEQRFHNVARGRLQDGVLTTERFDLRLIRAAQRMDSEYYLRDARLRLELDPETGVASGYVGGYSDLEWLAQAEIRIQDRTGRSSGKPAADAHGYTCPGKYYAIQRLADGHPDPQTGQCRSISVLHSVRAVPAFVLGPEASPDGDSTTSHGAATAQLESNTAQQDTP